MNEMNRPVKPKKKKHILRNILLTLAGLTFAFLVLCMLFGEDEEDTSGQAIDTEQETIGDYTDYDETYEGLGEETEDRYGDALCIEGTSLPIEGLRDYYVDSKAAQSAVVMVYMIGSDLETEAGSATDDINEMLNADLGDNVKIVLETGGAAVWQNEMMSDGKNERWLITSDGIDFIENAGNASMTEVQNLTDFISFSRDTFPADRYTLILWDHGGGTMGGFGWDEVKDNGGFTLTTLAEAIGASGVKFDIIGFDACLMATIETAYAMEPYADYLIASEEYESGYGWYYTDFLTKLGEQVSMDTLELGRNIIDDYAQFYDNGGVTLSMTDLREIPYVYEQLSNFLTDAGEQIKADNKAFTMVSMARSKAREYSDCESDQIDILDMVRRTENISGKEETISAIQSCVKYRNNSSLKGSNGLAMYFPYRELDYYSDTEQVLQEIHFDVPIPFYDYFLSIMAGAAHGEGAVQAPVESESHDYSSEDWYEDTQGEFDYGNDYEELYLEETDEGFVLQLSDEEWEQITDTQIALMMEFEDGYLDLGYDNVAGESEEGDLLVDYDGTWASINDVPVAFYANQVYEDSRGTIFSGTVNAVLNDTQMIELVLEWEPLTDEIAASDEFELKGFVKGYRIVNDQTLTQEKGLRTLKQGDRIAFLYDYYDEDYNYLDTYMQDNITVESQDALQVGYTDISDENVRLWGVLYDVYQQELYTETIVYSDR
ncbi:MAG: clostripain-related cysteine peptidase [bacterium]|nr:clostripain-related cysteine peptidase [bacterium]